MNSHPYLFQPMVKQNAAYDDAASAWTLGGAVSGYESLQDSYADGTTVPIWIRNSGGDWWYGYGVLDEVAGTVKSLTEKGNSGWTFVDEEAATLSVGPMPDRGGWRGVIIQHTQSIAGDEETYEVDFTDTASNWVDTDDVIRTDLPGTACGFYYGYAGPLLKIRARATWGSDADGSYRRVRMAMGVAGSFAELSITSSLDTDLVREWESPWLLLDSTQTEYPWIKVEAEQDSGAALDLTVELVLEFGWAAVKSPA